jgi:2-dehydro-3-deoxygalactonokinase
VVGGGCLEESTASYLSGLLIGAEVAAVPRQFGLAADHPIVLLGDPALCGFYSRAFARRGVPCEIFDGKAAAVAGLFALHGLGVGP